MACFARNTKKHEATGYSPFFLAKGWDPLIVADLVFPVWIPDEDDSPSVIAEKRKRAVLHAQKMTELAQQKRKSRYDLTHPIPHFAVGDLVWKIDYLRKPGDPLVRGPYRIIEQTDEKTFKLEKWFDGTGKEITTAVVEQMTPFLPPMFDDEYSRQLLNKYLGDNKDTLSTKSVQEICHTSDYFKQIFGDRLELALSQAASVHEDEDSGDAGNNIVSPSPVTLQGLVPTSFQGPSTEDVPHLRNPHNDQPGGLYSYLAPAFLPLMRGPPVHIVNPVNGEDRVINPRALQQQQVESTSESSESSSNHESSSPPEDIRDARDNSFTPPRNLQVATEGPAMGTRRRLREQQQQSQVQLENQQNVNHAQIPNE